jgi:diguanylate cyclase (GGDEF)-like protein
LYVSAVTAAAAVTTVIAALSLSFQAGQLLIFAVLLCCGLGSVEATRRMDIPQGGIVRDLTTVWCLPVAILLPPLYALIVPWPLLALTQWRVHRGIVYRRVFSAAAIGLAYGAASWTFRSLPLVAAGPSPGEAGRAAVWGLAVAGCDVLAWSINDTLIAAAIKASDRTASVRELFSREALSWNCIQWTVAVVVTLTAAFSAVLLVFAWPTVMVLRRGMMHKQLVSQARIDSKTKLLNAAAWEREATAAIARAGPTGAPLAVAIIDIDHFKAVNDSHGHLVGDKVLRAVSDRLRLMTRPGDLVGRFGGEEFVLLLLDAGTDVAYRIAERLRLSFADAPINVDPPAARANVTVPITVSIGVATLNSATDRTLTDLMAAADAALYRAKNAGRNRVCAVADTSPPAPPADSQADARASGEMGAGPSSVGGSGSAPGSVRA